MTYGQTTIVSAAQQRGRSSRRVSFRCEQSKSPPDRLTVQSQSNTPPFMDSPSDTSRPRVIGIHHFKFAVSNLAVSIAWYERVLGAHRVPTLDHLQADGIRFAAVCHMVDWAGLYLELRQAPKQALKGRGWDLVTLSVPGRADLLEWIEWLDRCGTQRSPLLVGMRGWVLVFEDPDGRRIKLFGQEKHGGTEMASTDEHWLSDSSHDP